MQLLHMQESDSLYKISQIYKTNKQIYSIYLQLPFNNISPNKVFDWQATILDVEKYQ